MVIIHVYLLIFFMKIAQHRSYNFMNFELFIPLNLMSVAFAQLLPIALCAK